MKVLRSNIEGHINNNNENFILKSIIIIIIIMYTNEGIYDIF